MRPNDRTGEVRMMKSGLLATIIEYRNCDDVDITFEQFGETVFNRKYHDFLRGTIKCPLMVEYIDDYARITNANTNPSTVFIMDIEDLPVLGGLFWCLNPNGYVRNSRMSKLLHRLIMKANPSEIVDHKNHCTTDNRKRNLRICTHNENMKNSKPRSDTSSGYKGVYYKKNNGRWTAQIGVNKKNLYLGIFDTPKEAAIAYNDAASRYHGDFANLNIL